MKTHTHAHIHTQYATKKERREFVSSRERKRRRSCYQLVDGDVDDDVEVGATSLHVQNGNIHR